MIRRIPAVIVAVTVALTAGACSGDGDEVATNRSTTAEVGSPSDATAFAASNTRAPTTASQAASIVAKHRGPLMESLDLIQTCFDRLGAVCFEAESVKGRYSKAINLAAAFEKELEAALPVDDEVAAITRQTLRDLEAVGAAVDANSEVNLDQVEERLVTVRTNLAAWEPYL